ncbi:MAG: carbohydrate ABC transporter permease [Anaerolineae bacterium]
MKPFRTRQKQRLLLAALYLVLIIPAIAALTPFIWIVSTSLKTQGEVFLLPIRWIPETLMFSNYVEVFSTLPFGRYILNTAIITVLATLGNEVSSLVVGYSLARLRWRGREAVFGLVLATMMLPSVVTLVPQFIMFFKVGWIDTYLPLIVPSWFGSAFFIFLFRQFMRGLPIEIDESARLEGANSLQILWHIVVPLSKPAIAAVAVFAGMAHYNDFMGPLLYLSKNANFTIQLGLYQFLGYFVVKWHLQMAAATVALAPLIILFFVAQRQFIEGVAFTGLSGR